MLPHQTQHQYQFSYHKIQTTSGDPHYNSQQLSIDLHDTFLHLQEITNVAATTNHIHLIQINYQRGGSHFIILRVEFFLQSFAISTLFIIQMTDPQTDLPFLPFNKDSLH